MRIGTWNLEGKWDRDRSDLLLGLDCELLLLTEVRKDVALPGYSLHRSAGLMETDRYYSAIASRLPALSKASPHPATSLLEAAGLRVASSVLPWRSASGDPWIGRSQGERTSAAVRVIVTASPQIWGGDWNQVLEGRIWSGSRLGQEACAKALGDLALKAPTASAPTRLGDRSINHIAIPADSMVGGLQVVVAAAGGRRLSDHDAYVLEVMI